jgi:rare lipoprotein A
MIRHVLAGGEFSMSDIRADVEAVERAIWAIWPKNAILILAVVTLVPGCAARSRTPTSVLDVREGLASYYGPGFDGKTTASGVRFDMQAMVAAHPSYAFGTVVRVTNLTNQRTVDVRVLDRGPARGPQADGVLIDLSYGAAQALGFIRQGRTRVRLEVLRWGN